MDKAKIKNENKGQQWAKVRRPIVKIPQYRCLFAMYTNTYKHIYKYIDKNS